MYTLYRKKGTYVRYVVRVLVLLVVFTHAKLINHGKPRNPTTPSL